ncbi:MULTISPECIES: DUF7331 family protein [Natronococcus]|uniref:Uncharacterized protein n=1 Tax=Natronococcus jeotgali DSM 18795 TaxID=1227498 RepID=L9WWG0_9EURY|nr:MULTISPECIES: hypothetical protein [Natronococcus]ELY53757.1 hypothetical protein C492_17403 [Natronococcus jeotgali DSM 18795]NKE37784.1 hypothetical protein [Natronococcus sp. JC468]
MDVPARRDEETETAEPDDEPTAIVCSHEPRPGKLVITERDNKDGWIATDSAVDLEP